MRYLIAVPICVLFVSGAVWLFSRGGAFRSVAGETNQSNTAENNSEDVVAAFRTSEDKSYVISATANTSSFAAPLLITPCILTPIKEQLISSELDGVLKDLCAVPGQRVKSGECLVKLDDRKLRLQIELLKIRANSTSAERVAMAHFEEADAKVKYAKQANRGGLQSVPELEYKTYLAQSERFSQEIKKAQEDRRQANIELEKARLLLELHQLRSELAGEVADVYKRAGETVKRAEPLFRVVNVDRLRIQGYCKVQIASRLRAGMHVRVDPELQGAQSAELVGHTGAIDDIAVSQDGKILATASEDKTVILWSWPRGRRLATLSHPARVGAVDIVRLPLAENQKESYVLVTGCDDKRLRVWSVSGGKVKGPKFVMTGHARAVRCVRIHPQGGYCASGGDDRKIGWWDMTNGTRKYWVHRSGAMTQTAHQGAVTGLDIARGGIMVSAGSDNVLRVWSMQVNDCKLLSAQRGRTGDVQHLGLSADGAQVIFDRGQELRILHSGSGAVVGRIQCGGSVRFRSFAHFSRSGRMVLSAAANNRVQVWHSLGHKIRHYQMPGAAEVRCAAFAPDERVFFTGDADGGVRVWSIPARRHCEPYEAVLTFVGSEMEQGTNLVRVEAEMDNSPVGPRRLRPGTLVTLRRRPQED